MDAKQSTKHWVSGTERRQERRPLVSSMAWVLIALAMLACGGNSKSAEAGAATGGTRPAGEGQISCRPVAPVAVVPTVGKVLHVAMTGADTNPFQNLVQGQNEFQVFKCAP